jgi:SpoVK/Ycf46/Vps4 family AAA+-type ATPase
MKTDISSALFNQIQEADKRAKHHLTRGEYGEAAKQLRVCYRLMRQYADYSSGATVKQMRLERAEQYLARATQAEERAKQQEQNVPAPLPAITERNASNDYQTVVEGLITTVDVGWDDIGGLEETKEQLQTSYALGLVKMPANMHIRPNRNLLLYGPPGTGKTMLAGAVSRELDATFFNARIPDLISQYFGESSKLLSALYAVAAIHAPSIIFLDEIDALSRQRGGGQESGAERRLLNTFLGELDGLLHKGKDIPLVFTIGATNAPWELDRAILSRFSGGRIYVPLPDAEARRAILALYIAGRGHSTQVPMDELVRRTQGYSGREIERIASLAVYAMLRRANPALLAQVAGGQDALRQYQLQAGPLQRDDFDAAFDQVKPSVSDRGLQAYAAWSDSL